MKALNVSNTTDESTELQALLSDYGQCLIPSRYQPNPPHAPIPYTVRDVSLTTGNTVICEPGVIIGATGGTSSMFRTGGDVEDLTIRGGTWTNCGRVLYSEHATRKCHFEDMRCRARVSSFDLREPDDCRWIRCRFEAVPGALGVRFQGIKPSMGCEWHQCHFQDIREGIVLESGGMPFTAHRITASSFVALAGPALYVRSGGSGLTVDGARFEGGVAPEIVIDPASPAEAHLVRILHCHFGTTSGGSTARIDLGPSARVPISLHAHLNHIHLDGAQVFVRCLGEGKSGSSCHLTLYGNRIVGIGPASDYSARLLQTDTGDPMRISYSSYPGSTVSTEAGIVLDEPLRLTDDEVLALGTKDGATLSCSVDSSADRQLTLQIPDSRHGGLKITGKAASLLTGEVTSLLTMYAHKPFDAIEVGARQGDGLVRIESRLGLAPKP